jgi:hypothetical protein
MTTSGPATGVRAIHIDKPTKIAAGQYARSTCLRLEDPTHAFPNEHVHRNTSGNASGRGGRMS